VWSGDAIPSHLRCVPAIACSACFICDDFEADAKKLFEIQDSMWPDAGRSTDETEKQSQS
jgi:hypothetical protein